VRKVVAVSLLAVAFLLVHVLPSYAGGHGGHGGHGFGHHHGSHHGFRGHGAIVIGPSFWWDPWWPWWYYPPPYYAYPPPPVIMQQPPAYPAPPAPPQSYWYYCQSAKAYYPSVETCAEAWIRGLSRRFVTEPRIFPVTANPIPHCWCASRHSARLPSPNLHRGTHAADRVRGRSRSTNAASSCEQPWDSLQGGSVGNHGVTR